MPTQNTTLKAYIQGRYRCITCGEFDEVQLGQAGMPGFRKCPGCDYDAQLLTTARGMAINPSAGVTQPGAMESRLGYIEGPGRPTRAKVGVKKRKHPNCSLCDCETFTKTGALLHAKGMRAQHLKRYDTFPCPFGPSFHVQLMEG